MKLEPIAYEEALLMGVTLACGAASMNTDRPTAVNTMVRYTALVQKAFPDKPPITVALDIRDAWVSLAARGANA